MSTDDLDILSWSALRSEAGRLTEENAALRAELLAANQSLEAIERKRKYVADKIGSSGVHYCSCGGLLDRHARCRKCGSQFY